MCIDCIERPATRCGRCRTPRCAEHAIAPGARCDDCERDYEDEAPTRRAAKMIFVPPIAILCGGLLFGVLMPVTLWGAFGAAVLCAFACTAAFGASVGACRFVDRGARAMFLRERAGGLPRARLLPARSHHR